MSLTLDLRKACANGCSATASKTLEELRSEASIDIQYQYPVNRIRQHQFFGDPP